MKLLKIFGIFAGVVILTALWHFRLPFWANVAALVLGGLFWGSYFLALKSWKDMITGEKDYKEKLAQKQKELEAQATAFALAVAKNQEYHAIEERIRAERVGTGASLGGIITR